MAQGEIYILKKITKFNNPMFPQKFLLCLQNSFLEDLWLIALHSSDKWGIDQKKIHDRSSHPDIPFFLKKE